MRASESFKYHEGMRAASSSGLTLSVLMEDGHAFRLAGTELRQVLTEIASASPQLLHEALEERLVQRVAHALTDRGDS